VLMITKPGSTLLTMAWSLVDKPPLGSPPDEPGSEPPGCELPGCELPGSELLGRPAPEVVVDEGW